MVLSANEITRLRKARASLWYGTCTINGYSEAVNPVTGITTVIDDAILYENIPCKLSHASIKSNDQTPGPAAIEHSIKVSITNEIDIPEGSTFTITQSGKTAKYKFSGEIGQFIVHQEVPLVIEKEYA